MGNDPMAVVDHELKVHGLDNLRVGDCSIFPTQIGGNTNAPAMMVGEKLSDMILGLSPPPLPRQLQGQTAKTAAVEVAG